MILLRRRNTPSLKSIGWFVLMGTDEGGRGKEERVYETEVAKTTEIYSNGGDCRCLFRRKYTVWALLTYKGGVEKCEGKVEGGADTLATV